MDKKLMMDSMRGFAKSKMVTVKIPAGNTSTQISFPDNNDLRYARILGMETFTVDTMAQSIPDFLPVITAAQLPLIGVTLETNDADEWYDQDSTLNNPNNTGHFSTTSQNVKWNPLACFNRILNPGVNPSVFEILGFNNLFVTWEKSYITMPTPITPISDIAVIFVVYYTFRSINGVLIKRS